jgi:hypothetical protein
VDTLFVHNDGDLDIRLYDACAGSVLASSLSIDDNESLIWTNTSGGLVSTKLWVEVFDFSAEDCNDYDLVLLTEAGGIGTKYCSANANSTGSPADISASGSASSSAGDLTVEASPVPNENGIFYHGSTQVQVPFGNGFRCAAGSVRRGTLATVGSNLASYTYDNSIPKKDLSAFIGSTRNFQFWGRDSAGGGDMFNTSNAVAIDILP